MIPQYAMFSFLLKLDANLDTPSLMSLREAWERWYLFTRLHQLRGKQNMQCISQMFDILQLFWCLRLNQKQRILLR